VREGVDWGGGGGVPHCARRVAEGRNQACRNKKTQRAIRKLYRGWGVGLLTLRRGKCPTVLGGFNPISHVYMVNRIPEESRWPREPEVASRATYKVGSSVLTDAV